MRPNVRAKTRWMLLAALLACGCSSDDVPIELPDALEIADSSTEPDVSSPVPDPPTVSVKYSEEREVCADRNPLRNLYFGDLHVHTALSFDAWVYQIRSGPAEAYRFAKGETVLLPPLGADGKGTRPLALEIPLDFTAVTDHAEYLGEIELCTVEGTAAYDTDICTLYRAGGPNSFVPFGIRLASTQPERPAEICEATGVDCTQKAKGVWARVVEAAEEHYDRTSACSFTALVGYEYSGGPDLSNLHRNVIFRNAKVPELPTTWFEEPSPQGLWAALKADCIDGTPGCDVLAIPHNANWSNGNMFKVEYPGAATVEEERAQAETRSAMEPLYELYQHKGDSECRNGFAQGLGAPDELCSFEKLRDQSAPDCGEDVGSGAMAGVGCLSRRDFVRTTLVEGLLEEARIGANPYKLGLMASTDTHAAIPGHVSESSWKGHLGDNDDEPEEGLKTPGLVPGGALDSPGGLTAVWAVENSRDALFDAMRRREVYGTSGPRIALRFYGGWDYPEGLCDDPAMLERAYAGGVAMGSDLASEPDGALTGPSFLVSALRDPRDSATSLQRIQIIKGWVDAAGVGHEKVYDVAGNPDNGASVDPGTCVQSGPGDDALCTVWRDPDWQPGQRAFWYARVVENPSCRWTAWWCNALPEGADSPPGCDPSIAPLTIQERAWSSPIWTTSPNSMTAAP
ncbi:MAG: hypothetical protein ACI9WU_001766 [Myxococcota bacterium]|jgi:hypothetical protein